MESQRLSHLEKNGQKRQFKTKLGIKNGGREERCNLSDAGEI